MRALVVRHKGVHPPQTLAKSVHNVQTAHPQKRFYWIKFLFQICCD